MAAIAVIFCGLTLFNSGLPGKPSAPQAAVIVGSTEPAKTSLGQLLRNLGFVSALGSQCGGYFVMSFTMCVVRLGRAHIQFRS
jgi:hypothetical protein